MAKSRVSIARPNPEGGKHIRAPESGNVSVDRQKPVFCFEHLASGFSICDCEKNEKAAILAALFSRSQLTWAELRSAPRHGLGYEIIDKGAINAGVPPVITEDVSIIAFRCIGKAPMVGYKDGNIFRVIWIDRQFKLYKHG